MSHSIQTPIRYRTKETIARGRSLGLVCPRCRGFLIDRFEGARRPSRRFVCDGCRADYGESAGFMDLRVASDRYLSLNQERRKAERVRQWESGESLEGLARRYYRITDDVSPDREKRFLRHIRDAQARGEALLARLPTEGEILDVGCGTGGFVAAAAARGRTVVGADIASRWLVLARKRLSGNGFGNRAEADSATRTSLIAACAEKLPFEDGRFPVVVADSLMEHTDDPVAALAEMVRVLRPGGVLHIWSPNRLWIGPDPHVGLVGLPLLPRGWARRYVKARRGPVHWPESRSPAEWAALLRRSGAAFVTIRPGAADLSGWPVSDSSLRGRSARTLGRLTRWPVASVLLRTIGPIGEVIVRKSANDEAMRPAEHESPELSP